MSNRKRLKPSQTPRGEKWIDNFNPNDQIFAARLLDSLHIAGADRVRLGISEKLNELVSDGNIEEPLVLMTALSNEDIIKNEEKNNKNKEAEKEHAKKSEDRIAYSTYYPGQKLSAQPGSEAITGNLIKNMTRHSSQWLPPTASIKDMRDKRIRSIVIVTDYSGSGTQVFEFAKTLTRNPTIRSWRSLGLVKIHLISYAASLQAKKLINSIKSPIDSSWEVYIAPTFESVFQNDPERGEILRICRDYLIRKDKKNRNSNILGYKNSFGLFSSIFSVPNNLPLILYTERGHPYGGEGKGWAPFFPGRVFPDDLVKDLEGYRTVEDVGLAKKSRTEKIIKKYSRKSSKIMVKALIAIHEGCKSSTELSECIGISSSDAKRLLLTLVQLEMVQEDLTLSAKGFSEVQRALRPKRVFHLNVAERSDYYYPSSMR